MDKKFFENNKIDILGSKISLFNLDETVKVIESLVDGKSKEYICVSNVHTVVMGMENSDYRQVTNDAILATADGVPLIWASKLLSEDAIHGRASGPDILAALLQNSKLKHFFYGSTNEVLALLQKKIRQNFPNANISGVFSPPFRDAKPKNADLEDSEIEEIEILNRSHADIIWVGLGAPKQELWMSRMRKHLSTPILIGVGAAFDFVAETKPRAPLWMQKSGLEWAHRLMSEPRRLAGRYLSTNPVFVKNVLKQKIGTWR